MQVNVAAVPYRRSAGTARTTRTAGLQNSLQNGDPIGAQRGGNSSCGCEAIFSDCACRSRLRRDPGKSLRGDAEPAIGLQPSPSHCLCHYWCVGRTVSVSVSPSPCSSHASGNGLPCQLNRVASGPPFPGPHPAYPSHPALLKRDHRAKALGSFKQDTIHGIGAGESKA